MPTGLIRRTGGRYSIRRRIPIALVDHYGKAEIVKALGTSDPTEARRLHPLAWAALDLEFDKALAHLRQPVATRTETPAPIDVATLSHRVLAAFRANRANAAHEGKLDEFNERLQDDLTTHQAVLDGQLEPLIGGIDGHEAHRNALRALLTGEGALSMPSPSVQTSQPTKTNGVYLSAVIDLWATEAKPTERTVGRTRNIAVRLEAVIGKMPIQDIRKHHMLAFKDALISEGQSPANINVMLGMIGTIFNYAVNKRHLIEANPAAKVSVIDNRRAKDKRRAFELNEIKAIFGSPVFSQNLRPEAGGGEAAYWLPLLALYTGARQTELGQLHPDDVVEETYRDALDTERTAWVIRIVENAARGQQVKNEGSERRIPIHADLIGLGFLHVAQRAKTDKRARIFADIQPSARGELMANWSKWFGRYRRKECGLLSVETPFHSFRHTFKHFARLSSIASDVHNEITGHETGDVADAYGGLSYPLHPLVEGMKKYRIPGFNLPSPPNG